MLGRNCCSVFELEFQHFEVNPDHQNLILFSISFQDTLFHFSGNLVEIRLYPDLSILACLCVELLCYYHIVECYCTIWTVRGILRRQQFPDYLFCRRQPCYPKWRWLGNYYWETKEEWIQEFGSRKREQIIHGWDESTVEFIGCSKNLQDWKEGNSKDYYFIWMGMKVQSQCAKWKLWWGE